MIYILNLQLRDCQICLEYTDDFVKYFEYQYFFYQHIFIIFQLESEEQYRMSKPLERKIISYNIIKKLGQGAYGVVYEALDNQNNKVAIKEIKMIKLNQCEKVQQLFKTQIAVLKGCNNENVIKFVDYFQIDQVIYLVTQFCNGGDLQSYLKRQTVLEDQAVEFLKQILNGFKGLHQVGAMHRDFKAENVLIHDGVCKIADLGFAKQMQQNQIAKTILGSAATMAPQVLDGTAYGFQADIWSIGVVFYQMLYKKYPYVGKNDFELKKNIKNSKPQYKDINLSNQSRDFLQKCLTVNPKNRINWKQIYDHPLITKNQGRILKSRLKVKQNKQFYENVKFTKTNNFQQKITQDRTVKIKILDKENVRISNISETLKREQQIKRQQQEAIQRFDRLFLKRRNDLMFFQKFVYPYISNLQYVYINHAVVSFVLSKKACIQVKQLQESIQKLDNPFIKQKGFDIYCKSENFQNMKILLQQDFQRIYKICDTEKKRIKITKQISQEIIYQFTDLTKSKTNRSYNSFTKKIIQQYFLQQKYDLVKNQSRTDFIRVSEALKYYYNTQQPRTHQFNLYIMKANFAQLEKKYFPKHTFI